MRNFLIIFIMLNFLVGCDLEYGAEYNTLANPIPEWEPREFIREGDYGVVDFAFIFDGQKYHIIGIDASVGHPWNQDNYINDYGFVHATSTDLVNWVEEEDIVEPLKGDFNYIWAPDIMMIDGIYHMWYTGVIVQDRADQHREFVVHSTSEDLYTWTEPEIVMGGLEEDDPNDLIKWGDGSPWANDLRDPHVFTYITTELGNPIYGMTISVRTNSGSMGIGLAICGSEQGIPDNNWQLLMVFNETIGTGVGVESSTYMKYEGKDYLFWTTWAYGAPEQTLISVDGDLKYSIPKKACEVLKDPSGEYYVAWLRQNESYIGGFDIKIETMFFDDDLIWFQE